MIDDGNDVFRKNRSTVSAAARSYLYSDGFIISLRFALMSLRCRFYLDFGVASVASAVQSINGLSLR